MITATNKETTTQALVSKGEYSLAADTAPPKGGGQGFRPHELLEAALASCMAITMRLVATERGIPLNQLNVEVVLDHGHPIDPIFRSKIEFDAGVSASDRRMLMVAASNCPVAKTLSKKIAFEHCQQ